MNAFQWVGVVLTGSVTILILGGFAWIQKRNTILQENQNKTHRGFIREMVDTAVSSMSKEMGTLGNHMSALSKTIDDERKERIESQRDITGLQENMGTCFKRIDRVESKLDNHIEKH